MSCRTQGVISRRPEGEYIRPKTEVIEGGFEVWRADFRPEEQILGLRGKIEALRADLKPRELI